MNQENWQEAKRIFNDALKLPANERAAYLDEVCAGHPALGGQVKTLLESYESGFLEETAVHRVTEIIGGNALKVGQKIGHYEIRETLGAGGMGEVFLAEDTELRRLVAIKILHTEVAEDKERVSRFIREARAASALNHPNILTIHEIGKFEDSRFIVSEYVKGETLRERLQQENLDITESLEIATQVAAALQAAHEAGIVHRDIKPENIIIRKDGLVKVLDFGLAKLLEPLAAAGGFSAVSAASTLPEVRTNPGMVMGTVAYMSPEQARGVAVDARTDIWSLGVCLYEMLSGKLPFPGDTTSDIIASILKTEAEPLENLKEEIPRQLEEICFTSLAKELDERYQTAQEFLQDLRRAKGIWKAPTRRRQPGGLITPKTKTPS
jgi:serine/threonine protein kinase